MSGNSFNKGIAASFFVHNLQLFKKKAIQWAQQFEQVCALDNNFYNNHLHHREEFLLAAGKKTEVKTNTNCFSTLEKYIHEHEGYKFGFITYDVKNEIEKLKSTNELSIEFPSIYFFIPEILIRIDGKNIVIQSENNNEESIFDAINNIEIPFQIKQKKAVIQSRLTKEKYIAKINEIKEYIKEGEVYELNFCQEFYCENYSADPVQLFQSLNEKSPAPFSCFIKYGSKFLISASPERFLMKTNTTLLSQPIKGTIKRSENKTEDEKLKNDLLTSAKDRAENVMIVDLVRNDLSRSCKAGSVEVEELFGIYSYPKVHQMISTVCGELKDELKITDALKNAFPMGSMTGAPKIRAMQLIDELENFRRGLYSGCVGYFSPENDLDFNVVIRSIQYDAEKKFLSFATGGAITIDSEPEEEYQECLLKAEAIKSVL